jgi:hypothetical protein
MNEIVKLQCKECGNTFYIEYDITLFIKQNEFEKSIIEKIYLKCPFCKENKTIFEDYGD